MAENKIPYKIYLDESEIPTQWYNVRADMKNKPAPLLNPATLKPMTHADLAPVFCDELIDQELDDTDAYIDIPEEIQNFYKMYRPSPLIRAYFLEKALDTPAKITTNSRATTQAEATSSTAQLLRLTTLKSRDLKVLQPKQAQVSGVLPFQWLVHISALTARYLW